ncbi:MAG: hypothetical protein KIT31_29030 [Deltaproteobacteria bacterium]|nr:hypothetical protein [Deltaproteobacteria bacterium]
MFAVLVGCYGTEPNPVAFCDLDSACIDPRFPYCDIDGTIGGAPGRCMAVDCTPMVFEVCTGDVALVCNATGDSYDRTPCAGGCNATDGCRSFCVAGMAQSCTNDTLVTCNAEGTATVAETCALGCASDSPRCLTFDPSNGLRAALDTAAAEPPITLLSGTQIDTSAGTVNDVMGNPVPLTSMRIQQADGSEIFALVGERFTIHNTNVTGASAVAFVADGPIEIRGLVTARAAMGVGGPGAGACSGGDQDQFMGAVCPTLVSTGAGGGGNAEAGGHGGSRSLNAGAPLTTFTPLRGGCRGGHQRDPLNQIVAFGGGGGGAVQLVSATKVGFVDTGQIDVGGGGGRSTAGGGAGGLIIIEAPTVSFGGLGTGVFANGGSGGGCGLSGVDSGPNTTPAPGRVCANYFSGDGGTATRSPGSGCSTNCSAATCPIVYGGGGGSVGRMRIVTRDGTFGTSGSPLFSVKMSTGQLVAK